MAEYLIELNKNIGDGGGGTLEELKDVNITNISDGDIISYDSTNQEYINQPKSLYPQSVELTKAEYDALVAAGQDDPTTEYFITDIDVAEAYYVETAGQTALTGATSLTFTNSHITPTSDIRILAEPASCKVSTNPQYKVSAKLSSVGSGTATIIFPALAENTEFWLLIECPLAIMQNDETKADKADLASINVIGSTNTTDSTISTGTYFYLNGLLVRAKADIATNATFTENTNYEVITMGGLNSSSLKWITLLSKTQITYETQYTITLPSNWNDLHIIAFPYTETSQKVVCTLTTYSISSSNDNWVNFGGATSTGNSGCKIRLGYNASTRVLSYYIETITWDGSKSTTPYIAMYVR